MAAEQTAVANNMGEGLPGLIADSSFKKNVRSYANEEASAEIPFGVAVGQGLNDDGCLLLAATTDKIIGVATRSHAYEVDRELGDIGLKPGATVGVLDHGQVWVHVETAVTPKSDVYIRAVAAGAEKPGAFRASADGTDTINASKWCRFLTSTAGAGYAVVSFDVDGRAA